MTQATEFDRCNSASVFKEVDKAAVTSDAHSLWQKIQLEISANGVDGAVSYLEEELRRLEERVIAQIEALEI